MSDMEGIQKNIKYAWIMICLQGFIGRGAKFQFVNTVVSCFTYGGTSCRHPFQTIEEDISIAEKYGLSHSKAMRYKIKMYTKNSIKIVLTRLRIWKAFYCLIKRDSIYKC